MTREPYRGDDVAHYQAENRELREEVAELERKLGEWKKWHGVWLAWKDHELGATRRFLRDHAVHVVVPLVLGALAYVSGVMIGYAQGLDAARTGLLAFAWTFATTGMFSVLIWLVKEKVKDAA